MDFDDKWDYADPAATEQVFRTLLPGAHAANDPNRLGQLLTQIARTHSLRQNFDTAHATLDEAEALLGTHGDLPVVRIRLLLERGRTFNSNLERRKAESLFHQAWTLALEAGEDGYAVDAAHMMEIVSEGEAKLEWNEKAAETAETSSDPAARRWLGSLYNNRGWTLHGFGRYEEALAAFETRLEWLRGPERALLSSKDPSGEIDIARWSIAKTLRLLGRPEEALVIQKELRATESGDADGYVHEEIAECLAALGRAAEGAPHFALAYRLLSLDPWMKRDEPERLERMRVMGGVESERTTGREGD